MAEFILMVFILARLATFKNKTPTLNRVKDVALDEVKFYLSLITPIVIVTNNDNALYYQMPSILLVFHHSAEQQ